LSKLLCRSVQWNDCCSLEILEQDFVSLDALFVANYNSMPKGDRRIKPKKTNHYYSRMLWLKEQSWESVDLRIAPYSIINVIYKTTSEKTKDLFNYYFFTLYCIQQSEFELSQGHCVKIFEVNEFAQDLTLILLFELSKTILLETVGPVTKGSTVGYVSLLVIYFSTFASIVFLFTFLFFRGR